MAKKMNPETGTEFSRAELKAAFEAVANKENWKMSIRAEIASKDRIVTEQAIIFFAGCRGTYTVAGKGRLLVTAVGYYVAIGS